MEISTNGMHIKAQLKFFMSWCFNHGFESTWIPSNPWMYDALFITHVSCMIWPNDCKLRIFLSLKSKIKI